MKLASRLMLVRTVLAFACILLAASWALAADTIVEEIIARVNSQIITRSDLQRSREQMLNEAKQRGPDSPAPDEKNVLRDLIDQQLLLQKGQELGITADTELVKRLDEMRKQMNLPSMEALEDEARKQGISFEDFKQNMKNSIITQQVIQREVGSRLNITPEDVKKFYEDHKSEMAQPEQLRLGEILIEPKPKPGESDEQALADAEQKAQQALAAIKGGKNFAEAAREYSNGPTAEQGGDLGYFKRGTLAKELEDKVFAMKDGEVSDVVHTRQGFVILQVNDHQQAGVPPLKQVEPQVQETLYMQRLQPALREYLTKLREDSYIDIKAGYVDAGASPNQTKPVAVASESSPTGKAPPKRRKKFGIFPR